MNGDMKEDTIAAIATAPGQGGIGIVRISGPETEKILREVFRPAGLKNADGWESHRMMYGRITDGGQTVTVQAPLDEIPVFEKI